MAYQLGNTGFSVMTIIIIKFSFCQILTYFIQVTLYRLIHSVLKPCETDTVILILQVRQLALERLLNFTKVH